MTKSFKIFIAITILIVVGYIFTSWQNIKFNTQSSSFKKIPLVEITSPQELAYVKNLLNTPAPAESGTSGTNAQLISGLGNYEGISIVSDSSSSNTYAIVTSGTQCFNIDAPCVHVDFFYLPKKGKPIKILDGCSEWQYADKQNNIYVSKDGYTMYIVRNGAIWGSVANKSGYFSVGDGDFSITSDDSSTYFIPFTNNKVAYKISP